FRIDVDPADEDAVDRLQAVRVAAPLRAAPDRVTGCNVLPRREHQRDVERGAGGRLLLERGQAGWSRRRLDHAVGVPGTPFLAQLDVTASPLCLGQRFIGV